jgi:acetyl esterase/lipase
MAHLAPGELRRFTADPIEHVTYDNDIDYVGDGIHQHRLDVIAPGAQHIAESGPLPVYVYFHGGGWTSGDKAPLTRYCAMQAMGGMVVVNVNYRMAPRHDMHHMMDDANRALAWVREHIAAHGGDPDAIVVGGDSAGGQLSALLAAATSDRELAEHYGIVPAAPAAAIRGVVQHCSAVDLSVVFERGFILSQGFVRMLVPGRIHRQHLREATRALSPIEWVSPDYPPVLVTTSERDFFYLANLRFIDALRDHGVHVDVLVSAEAQHTWQQDTRHSGSAEVYERLHAFVARVSARSLVA